MLTGTIATTQPTAVAAIVPFPEYSTGASYARYRPRRRAAQVRYYPSYSSHEGFHPHKATHVINGAYCRFINLLLQVTVI